MILDNQLVLSDAQALTATAASTNVLDLKAAGLYGNGEPLALVVWVDVAADGTTVLLIEHVMKAVLALANRLLVLHHGQKIAEGPPSEVLRDARVIEVYLGR